MISNRWRKNDEKLYIFEIVSFLSSLLELIKIFLCLLTLLQQIYFFYLQGPHLFLEGSQFVPFQLSQHVLILNIFFEGEVIQMSKKYFINNLDTAFGQTLISELVKEPT